LHTFPVKPVKLHRGDYVLTKLLGIAIAAACLLGTVASQRFATAQTPQQVLKWELAMVHAPTYNSSEAYTCFFAPSGCRVETTKVAKLGALPTATAKLAADGWEVVGYTRNETGGPNSEESILFRRRIVGG
jgi:hypothetical protein